MKNSKFSPGKHAAAIGIAYRPITQEDMGFLSTVYRSTREEELAQSGWSEAQICEFVDMQFKAQHAHYQQHYPDADWLIVQENQTPIGRLYIEEWPSEFRLIDIALLPQSRKGGKGTAILSDILELAANAEKAVGIHVEKFNPAMQLYAKLGFVKSEDKGVYDLLHWRKEQRAVS